MNPGNLILLGVGGTGRRSLSKLAAFLTQLQFI
jgi:hypothetical protein